ncbi:DUF2079 domain-containing protein [Actinospica sp. MGRD01-02]|uniref:DUF2079 domain-containing protein n=1 Tax=Actinospica acidithermotolerans TaxID=2828514 RepID=A0A941IJ14_9ACTN|nr:DUF2079 domain-containing protein [Actinospica acidithermotolerans]MBR7827367.1 DUF2079 domain-containing protein [Actinospica acidithermotolerans]
MLEEAPARPVAATPSEPEVVDVPAAEEPPAARPGAGRRVARGLRRALLSPCTWIVSAAFTVYWIFAYNEYMQQQAGACDLGIFYQATVGWAYRLYPYVAIKGYAQIGDHFSPIYVLLAPAIWIHNSPATLILAQVVLLCLSGIPVYIAIRRVWGIPAASLLLIAYLFSIGMQGSVNFPVHEVMFSAPLIAWGLERALAGRWTWASVLIGMTAFVKEDMGMLIVMFALWLAFNRKWRHAAILAVWGIGMFLVTVNVIIPHFNPAGFTYADDYATTLHATTFTGEIEAIVLHPVHTLQLMFGGEEKAQLWTHVLLPVAFLCLGSPISLMALPSLVTSTLSGRVGHTEWSWNLYYEMPLMPILFIGAMDGTNRLIRAVRRVAKWNEAEGMDWLGHRLVPPIAGIVLGLFALQITWSVTQTESLGYWMNSKTAYTAQSGQIQNVTQALKYVPSGVEVRATNNLVIPLAARDTVTLVGSKVEKGPWAAMDLASPGCPVTPDYMAGYLSTLEKQGFQIVDEEGSIVILHQA